MLGNILRGREQQYVAHRDDTTSTWRILDTWHEALTQVGPDDDIEDNNPAVTILTEGAFISLIREAARMGVLQNASFEGEEGLLEDITQEKDDTIIQLRQEIADLKETNAITIRKVQRSEDYELKEKAMNNIVKLVSMSDMTNLTERE